VFFLSFNRHNVLLITSIEHYAGYGVGGYVALGFTRLHHFKHELLHITRDYLSIHSTRERITYIIVALFSTTCPNRQQHIKHDLTVWPNTIRSYAPRQQQLKLDA